jgi:ankyrin repeat protein
MGRFTLKTFYGWWVVTLLSVSAVAFEGDQRLVEAVKNRNQHAARELIEQRADVNVAQADGATPLAWAAYWNNLELADLLLGAGAKPNLANDYGVTPLALACGKGSAAMVEKLLQSGADPNQAQQMGVTPLMICARTGNAEAVKSLLARKANVNAKQSRRGQTALMWAASAKHPEVVRLLLEHGADPNAVSHRPSDFTPARYITWSVHPGEPERIDPEDVHPDPASSRGWFTALMFAARSGDVESARILAEGGADVSYASAEYGSALVMAAASGHEAVALLLLEKGADPKAADRWGFTALHYALRGGIVGIGMSREPIPTDSYWLGDNMAGLVKTLLDHGADPNARITHGIPPFDYPPFARTTGHDMPQLRQPGLTPFLLATASLDTSLMRLLHSRGADPRLTTDEGITALMIASGMGRIGELTEEEETRALEAARLTIELGGDPKTSSQEGRTALGAAAYLGANRLVQFLVEQGADLEAKDKYGRTSLQIAQGVPPGIRGRGDGRFRFVAKHEETAKLLLRLGARPQDSSRASR